MRTRQIVHDILRDYPETRNSDKVLFLKYVELYGNNCWNTTTFSIEHFDFIGNFIRVRAYWQNTKHMFLPAEWVKKGRKQKEAKIVKAIREENKDVALVFDYVFHFVLIVNHLLLYRNVLLYNQYYSVQTL